MVLRKKKYGHKDNTMVLWKNEGTIPRTMDLRFKKEKNNGRLPKKLTSLIYNVKKLC